jgi:signal transduction histidine kinase
MTNFTLTCFINGIFSIVFAVFVLWRGRLGKTHNLWALTCLLIAGWAIGLGLEVMPVDYDHAMRWGIFSHAAAILIPIVYLHFISEIFRLNIRRTLLVGYSFATVLEVLNAFGALFSVRPILEFPYYTVAKPMYYAFTTYFGVFSLVAHQLLWRQASRAQGALRTQAAYIFTGTSVAFIGGSTTFFLVFDVPIYPYGVYSVFFYIPVVSFAIIRHRLLDLRIVVRRTLVYSAVTAILTATYVTVLFLITRALEGVVGRATVYSSAIAAGVIAILFHPLRNRLQQALDRRFPRESLDQTLLREATSGFVHEIKRPLAKMGMPAQLAIQELERLLQGREGVSVVVPKVIERLKFIVQESMEAGATVEALRELVSAAPSSPKPVDAGGLLQAVLANLRSQAHESAVRFDVEVGQGLPPILGHEKQLEIALLNVIKNAIEAASANPLQSVVSIQMREREGELLVVVRDSGPGIPSSDLPRIFAPYFSTKKGKGMGVGLWLAQEIVRNHGGSIECQSEIGKGTTFRILLPVGAGHPQ